MTAETKLFTYDDYLELPKDCFKYEVIEGELITRPTPHTIHQIVSGNLLVSITGHLKKNKLGKLFLPIDVVFSMTNIVIPDLMFISNERSQIITEKNIVEAPDLIVEIISEGTKVRDQTTKKSLYERYGVKEYWLVYPHKKKIEQFVLRDETFDLKSEVIESENLVSEVIEGFSISLDQVFSE